jgi:hypothetical protein
MNKKKKGKLSKGCCQRHLQARVGVDRSTPAAKQEKKRWKASELKERHKEDGTYIYIYIYIYIYRESILYS